jgi:hypothetical protein
MITDEAIKSSERSTVAGRMPAYGWAGLASMVLFEILLFAANNTLIGWFFTPIQWTGLILFLDGLRKRRRGTSLLSDYPREFFILALISIGSWSIFEGYNVLLRNWTYVGLPVNSWIRFCGYAWAFATISPAMFLIYETISDLLPGNPDTRVGLTGQVPGEDTTTYPRLPNSIFWPFVVFGFLCLVIPLIFPSTGMTPLVWMGFAFFLDPINGRRGDRSILSEFFTGERRSMPVFFLSGLVSGLIWEFWNYWATAKWHYDVPYFGHIRLFEMPVLGFLGFMPFIIESLAIYRFVRRLIPIRDEARYLG